MNRSHNFKLLRKLQKWRYKKISRPTTKEEKFIMLRDARSWWMMLLNQKLKSLWLLAHKKCNHQISLSKNKQAIGWNSSLMEMSCHLNWEIKLIKIVSRKQKRTSCWLIEINQWQYQQRACVHKSLISGRRNTPSH